MFVALIRECFYWLLDKNSGGIGGELQEIEILELKMQILQLRKERLDQYFLIVWDILRCAIVYRFPDKIYPWIEFLFDIVIKRWLSMYKE